LLRIYTNQIYISGGWIDVMLMMKMMMMKMMLVLTDERQPNNAIHGVASSLSYCCLHA